MSEVVLVNIIDNRLHVGGNQERQSNKKRIQEMQSDHVFFKLAVRREFLVLLEAVSVVFSADRSCQCCLSSC